jgi:signal transduction histidine kinase
MDGETNNSELEKKLEQLRPLFEKADTGVFDCCVDTSTSDPVLKEILEGIATILSAADKKLGALQDSEKMKEEFLALAAHQLRSPLSIMRWDMELLSNYEDHLPTEIIQKIEVLSKNNKKMINLVNDILTVSKINLDKIIHHIEAVDAKAVLEKILQELQSVIKAKELNIEFLAEENLPQVYVDLEKLQDVLMNLIENSIKFTPALGQIQVSASKRDESVLIEVSDSGIGIPKDELPNLTQKFFRATNAVEGQSSGTGLGLFIAKEYLTAWGGKLMVESPANEKFQEKIRIKDLPGTTVYVSLPIKGGDHK